MLSSKVVDVLIRSDGCNVVGYDVKSSGESGGRSRLMTCQSPEHARIVAAIMDSPVLMLYHAMGVFTQEKIDEMADKLRAAELQVV